MRSIPGAPLVCGYSRRSARIAASTMCAHANSCAIAAATSGKRFGSTMVGAAGQTMRTTAGMLSGSTNSTLRWSWLIWPDVRGVMG